MRRHCCFYGGLCAVFGLGILVGGLLTAVLTKWILGCICIALGVLLLRL